MYFFLFALMICIKRSSHSFPCRTQFLKNERNVTNFTGLKCRANKYETIQKRWCHVLYVSLRRCLTSLQTEQQTRASVFSCTAGSEGMKDWTHCNTFNPCSLDKNDSWTSLLVTGAARFKPGACGKTIETNIKRHAHNIHYNYLDDDNVFKPRVQLGFSASRLNPTAADEDCIHQ